MDNIKISIVMPNFNCEKYLEKAINAFFDNEYINKELVIVDGKSTDKSHEIIKKFKRDNLIWIKDDDKGISNAINIGLKYCTGDIIGYLGADDLLNTNTLKLVNDYKKLIDFDAIYFDSYTHLVSENKLTLRKCPLIQFNKSELLKFGTIVGLQNIFFDKRVYLKNQYNEKNKYSMDYEIYFDILKDFNCFLYHEYPATINIFDNNISNVMSIKQKQESDLIKIKHSSVFTFYCWKVTRFFKTKCKKILIG